MIAGVRSFRRTPIILFTIAVQRGMLPWLFTLYTSAPPFATSHLTTSRENKKKEERKGGVPRRDGEMCTAFRMIRRVIEGSSERVLLLEQSGENEELEGEIFEVRKVLS